MAAKKVKDKKTFPKIATKTKVKTISTVLEGVKVKFDNPMFSDGQYEQLHQWLVDKDELLITIEQIQAKMDKSTGNTDEIPFEEDKPKN